MKSCVDTSLMSEDDPRAHTAALAVLRAGGIVIIPTDTVYGVACDPWSAPGVERLYAAKERPHSMAIPVLVSSVGAAVAVAESLPEAFDRLAERFWPGGLTLVVYKHEGISADLVAGGETVALRHPKQGFALRLIEEHGGALAVTSANITGQPAPTTAEGAMEQLSGRVELVVDGGTCSGGVSSTIVDLTATPPRLLREGAISIEELIDVLPKLCTP